MTLPITPTYPVLVLCTCIYVFHSSTPGLKPELESVIQRYKQHGVAVLMFERVSVGHAGKYTCSAAGEDNEVKFEYVEVKVLKKGEVEFGCVGCVLF